MTDGIERLCENCKFSALYENEHGDIKGWCRRHPPTVVVMGGAENMHPTTRWPEINSDDWCGAYEARADEE